VSFPTLTDIRTEQANRSLLQFTMQAWPVIEPATVFVSGWHIEAICEHLEAAYKRQIRNLIINIPPRHMKSLLVSVFWPAWVWGPGDDPESRWLTTSYGDKLAIRDARKTRHLIGSEWYRARWGHKFDLLPDQNQKSRFENTKLGYRVASGAGGAIMGEGGDYLIVDDPHKADDADSANALEGVSTWWDQTMSTRASNPKTSVKVVIMQRLHDLDLAGHIQARAKEEHGGEWEVLSLPARYEPTTRVTGLGWSDPRRTDGDLLWPERFGENEVAELEMTLGEYGTAAQLQQRPAPRGGGVYKEAWWGDETRYDFDDRHLRAAVVARWLSLDTAITDKETSAFSTCVVIEMLQRFRGHDGFVALVRHVERDKLTYPKLVPWVEGLIPIWNYDTKLQGVVIENKSSGIALVQSFQDSSDLGVRRLIRSYNPKGSKVVRSMRAGVWCSQGCILLPKPCGNCLWLFPFEQEIFRFPNAPYADQADAFAQGIDYIRLWLSRGLEQRRKEALGLQDVKDGEFTDEWID